MPRKRASKTAKRALHKRFKSFCKLCLKSVRKTVSKLKRGRIVPKLNLSNLGFVAGLMVLILIGLSVYSVRVGRTQPPSLGFLPNNFTASLVLDINKLEEFSDSDRFRFQQNKGCSTNFNNFFLRRLETNTSIKEALLSNVVSASENVKFYYVVVSPSVKADEFGRKIWDFEKPFFAGSRFFEPFVETGDILADPGYNSLLETGTYVFAFFSESVELCQLESSTELSNEEIQRDGFSLVYVDNNTISILDNPNSELEILRVFRTTLLNSQEVSTDLEDLSPGFYWIQTEYVKSTEQLAALQFLDTDLDGVLNEDDLCTNVNLFDFVDSNGCEDFDNDGVVFFEDNCPNNSNANQIDRDFDGRGDSCDAFPEDADETTDTDNDGVGDNADAFPNDPSETQDSDNDGVGDNADAFLLDDSEDTDTDGDGVGDNADAFPNDASETHPNDPSETQDSDNDGVGDNADAFPNDPSETQDSDNDGVGDNADAFPNDPSETQDSDNDGAGDNVDIDDDNDTVDDVADNCPVNATLDQSDFDEDGIGDACDADTDNDGVDDIIDACPLTLNRLEHENLTDFVTANGCYDEDQDGVFARDVRLNDFDLNEISDFSEQDNLVAYDNCYATDNSDQADNDGFNDGKTLGDACEDMNITLQKLDDSNMNLNLHFMCRRAGDLVGSCTFVIDFGVEIDDCPSLTQGEENIVGALDGRVCAYEVNERQDVVLAYDYPDAEQEANVRVIGDVRQLKFGRGSTIQSVDRFGDLNYLSLEDMFKFSLIENVEGESDFSNVETFKAMFSHSFDLRIADVSEWDMSAGVDTSLMFRSVRGFSELDIGNWDMSQVEDMGQMFYGASNLTSLNVGSWDVSFVLDMSRMFSESALTSLDVSEWDVSEVEKMNFMFLNASSLVDLNVSSWDVRQVTSMGNMFGGASELESLDVSEWVFTEGQHAVLKVGMGSLREEVDVYLGANDWSFILDGNNNRTVLQQNNLYCETVDDEGRAINLGIGCIGGNGEVVPLDGEDGQDGQGAQGGGQAGGGEAQEAGGQAGGQAGGGEAQEVDDGDEEGVVADDCIEGANANVNQSDHDEDGLVDVCDGDMDNDGVLNAVDACPFTKNRLEHDNLSEFVTDEGCYDEDDDGAFARDIRFDDFDNDGAVDFAEEENPVVYDNCYATVNPNQADSDGFNDGKTLGDACEDMKFTLVKPDDALASFALQFKCNGGRVGNECDFNVDFGLAIDSCPDVSFASSGEVSGSGTLDQSGQACAYELSNHIYNNIDFDYANEVEEVAVSISGDVRYVRLREGTTVVSLDRFGDLNYWQLDALVRGLSSLVEVSGESDFSSVVNMQRMFRKASALRLVDVSEWDVSSVQLMSWMFDEADNLVFLDVDNWDVSNVERMHSMFRYADDLVSLDVSRWDVSRVLDMRNMFQGASNLISLDVSRWDVSSVEFMSWMFYGASNLTSLDVSEWDVSFVTGMRGMFEDASNLERLDLSGWDVSSVTDMGQMFQGASNLLSLNVGGWNLARVESMRNMFYGVRSLVDLDLNSWDVSSVTNMDNMFNDMRSLERLDLSGWDVSSAAGMRSMFYNLGKLEHLDLSDWVFDAGQHDMIKSVFSRNRVFGAPSGRNFDVYLGDVDWSFILYDDGRRSVLRNNDLYCGLRDVDGGDINVDLGCVVD